MKRNPLATVTLRYENREEIITLEAICPHCGQQNMLGKPHNSNCSHTESEILVQCGGLTQGCGGLFYAMARPILCRCGWPDNIHHEINLFDIGKSRPY